MNQFAIGALLAGMAAFAMLWIGTIWLIYAVIRGLMRLLGSFAAVIERAVGLVPEPAATPAAPAKTVPTQPEAPKPATIPPAAAPVAVHESAKVAVLVAANAKRWAAMHIKAERLAEIDAAAARLCAADAKARYVQIAAATGVPWHVVAVIHEREAGGPPHWDRQLAQGDPLDEVSTHEPKGLGPFHNHPDDPPGQDAFYRGALVALKDAPPQLAKWTDWSAGGTLAALETMNGLGYANQGVPSAYIWSGSDQYVSGKYVRDHVYDPNAVDVQLGCAPLISRMMALDPSIKM